MKYTYPKPLYAHANQRNGQLLDYDIESQCFTFRSGKITTQLTSIDYLYCPSEQLQPRLEEQLLRTLVYAQMVAAQVQYLYWDAVTHLIGLVKPDVFPDSTFYFPYTERVYLHYRYQGEKIFPLTKIVESEIHMEIIKYAFTLSNLLLQFYQSTSIPNFQLSREVVLFRDCRSPTSVELIEMGSFEGCDVMVKSILLPMSLEKCGEFTIVVFPMPEKTVKRIGILPNDTIVQF